MRTGTTGNLMETPICDFVRGYAQSGVSRLHMPGHKGRPVLGCEPLDITEVAGADELYAPTGIIAQSEANAAALFGAAATFYSTEDRPSASGPCWPGGAGPGAARGPGSAECPQGAFICGGTAGL